jgi:ABC-type dipeptide/oligopeptide/nickel transport system permease component
MRQYLFTQLGIAVPTLLVVVTLVFLLVRLVPGDPALVILGDRVTPDALARLRAELYLDRSLPEQYVLFLRDLLRGGLGTSILTGRPVIDELAGQAPATLQLAVSALIVGPIIGLTLGVFAAINRGRIADRLLIVLATLGVTVPGFWLGMLLILLFSAYLNWLPAIGVGEPTLIGQVRALIMPTIVLGFGLAGSLARITRSSMLEVLGDDYVRTARAKGLSEAVVLLRHTLRNAGLPIVTVLGLQFANLLSGAVLVETVFSRPGLGNLVVQAVNTRDYPVVQGSVIVFGIVFVLVNLLVDLGYGAFDPRIRYS